MRSWNSIPRPIPGKRFRFWTPEFVQDPYPGRFLSLSGVISSHEELVRLVSDKDSGYDGIDIDASDLNNEPEDEEIDIDDEYVK